MAFHDRLRLARLRAGLSLAALAEKLDTRVSPQAINKYEKGEMMPSSSVLVSLAGALSVSLDFLMSNQVIALEGVEFRKRASVAEKEKALVESEVIDFVERYLSIEAILDLPEKPSALEQIRPATINTPDAAEEHAEKLRESWKLGGEPIPSMTALLEEKDVRVIEIDGPDGFSGLTCRIQRPAGKPPIHVVVRRRMNVERGRFTLAHELGHAVVGEVKEGKTEKAVDVFAGAFLVPSKHLKKEVGDRRTSLGYQELVQLKRMYGVSMWALLMRLQQVGIISDSAMKNLYRTPARKWLKDEPEPLAEDNDIAKLEQPRRFELYVYRALAEGLIPSTKAATLLRKSISDVEEAVKGPGT
jgi:Zn-dependent peptidase ImmA (M78 family)/DNA-binding XRE family transcriptional regulator